LIFLLFSRFSDSSVAQKNKRCISDSHIDRTTETHLRKWGAFAFAFLYILLKFGRFQSGEISDAEYVEIQLHKNPFKIL